MVKFEFESLVKYAVEHGYETVKCQLAKGRSIEDVDLEQAAESCVQDIVRFFREHNDHQICIYTLLLERSPENAKASDPVFEEAIRKMKFDWPEFTASNELGGYSWAHSEYPPAGIKTHRQIDQLTRPIAETVSNQLNQECS